jgi:predicted helicase
MTALETLLDTYRKATQEKHQRRERGNYFEELIVAYLRNEASYRDLYRQVWTYPEWAQRQIRGIRQMLGLR